VGGRGTAVGLQFYWQIGLCNLRVPSGVLPIHFFRHKTEGEKLTGNSAIGENDDRTPTYQLLNVQAA